MKLKTLLLILATTSAVFTSVLARGWGSDDSYKIYQTTPYGTADYSKGWEVDGNRTYQLTPYGTRDYSKPGYIQDGDRTYQTTPYGTKDYSRGWIRKR